MYKENSISFEDEVMARSQSALQSQLELGARERDAVQAATDKLAAEGARFARVAAIGKNAANILLAAEIPTLPIWDDVEYGEPRRESSNARYEMITVERRRKALMEVGKGWHLVTRLKRQGDGSDDWGTPERLYTLTTEGTFTTFSSRARDYFDPRDKTKKHIDGIINPYPLRAPYASSQIVTETLGLIENGDVFLNAVVYMCETGNTYRA